QVRLDRLAARIRAELGEQRHVDSPAPEPERDVRGASADVLTRTPARLDDIDECLADHEGRTRRSHSYYSFSRQLIRRGYPMRRRSEITEATPPHAGAPR